MDLAEKPTLQAAWHFAACMLAHPTQEYRYTSIELPISLQDVVGPGYYRERCSFLSGNSADCADVLEGGGKIAIELERCNIVLSLQLVYLSDDQPIEVILRGHHVTTSQPYVCLHFSFRPETKGQVIEALSFAVPISGIRGEVYVPVASGLKRWFDLSEIELTEMGPYVETIGQLFRLAEGQDKKKAKVLVRT
jgi:hypothetical protein